VSSCTSEETPPHAGTSGRFERTHGSDHDPRLAWVGPVVEVASADSAHARQQEEMAMNIIELIESQLDDRFTQTATRETGLSADQTRTATRAAIPALLASLLSAFSKPGGMKALGSLLKD